MARCRTLIWIFAASIIFNILVAWGCMLWSPYFSYLIPTGKTEDELPDTLVGPDGSRSWWRTCMGFGVFWSAPAIASVTDETYFHGFKSSATPSYYRCGWPMLSIQSLVKCQQAPDGQYMAGRGLSVREIISRGLQTSWLPRWLHVQEERRLPIVPLWLGFSVDTLFYFGVFSFIVFAWKWARSWTPNTSSEVMVVRLVR